MKDKDKSRDQLLNELSELNREVMEKERILNFSNDLICIIGIDGYFKYLNLAWERACGYSREELLSRSVFDFVHQDDRHKNHNDFFALLAANKPNIDYENHLIHKNGSIRIVSWTATPLPEEGLIYCIGRDITERKQAETALKQSEEKFRSLAEESPNMIFINNKGRVVYTNLKCVEIMGYARDEFYSVTFNFLNLIAPEYRDMVKASFQQHKQGKEVPPYEYAILTKGGERVEVIITTKLIDYNNDKAILGIATDITERKRAEEILKEKDRELEIKAKNLEEANIALKVLLRRTDEDRAELEEKVSLNVRDLVIPYLEKLKISGIDEIQRTFVNILKSNLLQITSPFTHRMSSKFLNFTPTEIQVADLLRKGKTSKEIGELLNTSPRAITFHRENIRKKLGLKNKKANLKSYLLSLK
jgi:PAS domain S-box-containing protein